MPEIGHTRAPGWARIRPARFHYESGHSTGTHHHPEHQLIYASRGLLCVETVRSRWVVPPFRAVWVPAHTPHAVVAETKSEMATLYLDETISVTDLDDVVVISVSPLLRELIHHLLDADPSGPARARVEEVVLDQLALAPTAPLALPELRDPRLRAIAELLGRNPRDRRTLREFGLEVGAAERTLQRLFTVETGTTFGRWRTQLRLQHGIIALGQGQTVSAAAASSGYREASAFIAAFRAAFGTTPARYFIEQRPP